MGKLTKREDKQRISLQTHALITRVYYSTAKSGGISYTMLRDLINISDYYKRTGNGISPAELNNCFGCSHGTYRNLFDRLNSLLSKGYIININHSYLPTQKAIQLINSITI